MAEEARTEGSARLLRWSVVLAVALVAFFATYRFAIARGNAGQPVQAATQSSAVSSPVQGSAPGRAASGSTGCACCGGAAASGPAVTGKAALKGDVQKITVDVSKGYFDPSTIQLTAGIPAEITFGQGSGCLAQVQSQELGFFEDLQKGPITVKLPALTAGTYAFTCGMQMQSGSIVVE